MNNEVIFKLLEMALNNTSKSSEKEHKNEYEYQVGKNYFIRTVTHYLVGELAYKTGQELVLRKCSWVADTGRYHDALKTGILKEVEPYNQESLVHVNRGSFIDAVIWDHDLPKDQK